MTGLRLSSPAWRVYRVLRDVGADPAPLRALGYTDAVLVSLLAEIRQAGGLATLANL